MYINIYIYIIYMNHICKNLLYNSEDVIEGIDKSDFKNLLLMAT